MLAAGLRGVSGHLLVEILALFQVDWTHGKVGRWVTSSDLPG